jgi:hypothetical protein
MTFDEFQTICTGVATTGTPASAPCPIYIGNESGPTVGSYGLGLKPLVILKEQVPNAEMVEILNTCRFSFDEPNNQTVIQPITHEGTG